MQVDGEKRRMIPECQRPGGCLEKEKHKKGSIQEKGTLEETECSWGK